MNLDLRSLSLVRQRAQDSAVVDRRYCLFAGPQLVTCEGQDGALNVWLSEQELQSDFGAFESLNIGATDEYALFVAKVPNDVDLPAPYLKTSLLSFMLNEPEENAQLVGRAAQLLHWQESNQFCGCCGRALIDSRKEYSMTCETCVTTVYPRIAPCIITLVTDKERMLLATNSQTHGKWYSTLAGFVEPGESLEQALAREVHEEVGVSVKNIRYFSSQPWPFPAQLMIGFFAEYAGGTITPDGVEIEHADWFEVHSLPQTPGKFSIAGKLIHHFIDNHVK